MKQSRETEIAHVERLRRKQDQLEMLSALIFSWEKRDDKDPRYLKKLYRKRERIQNQINVMAL